MKHILVLFITLLLTACHILPADEQPQSHFSDYYLWIKSLNQEELQAEITHQKRQKALNYANADMQLIMLYSLPNAPIHNPFTAKAQLNSYQLEPYSNAIFTPKDLAFVVMLKDQLNQQLLLLQSLENYKGAYKQAQTLINTQQKQLEQHQQKIAQLNKQIVQLKKIEQAINKRGQ